MAGSYHDLLSDATGLKNQGSGGAFALARNVNFPAVFACNFAPLSLYWSVLRIEASSAFGEPYFQLQKRRFF
jgi:hypothetical protein